MRTLFEVVLIGAIIYLLWSQQNPGKSVFGTQATPTVPTENPGAPWNAAITETGPLAPSGMGRSCGCGG